MQLDAVLDKAITETANVVHGVEPDQLTAPTPCTDWDVRALINHLLQVVCALSLAGRRQPVPNELWNRSLMADGWADHFDDEARAATAAWTQPATWEDTISLGDTQMPAPMVATMLVSDLAIHGWDLAAATGQNYRCDEDVAEVTRRFVIDTGEQGRQMGIYAARLPVADSASAFVQALAVSGRNPQWTHAPTD